MKEVGCPSETETARKTAQDNFQAFGFQFLGFLDIKAPSPTFFHPEPISNGAPPPPPPPEGPESPELYLQPSTLNSNLNP